MKDSSNQAKKQDVSDISEKLLPSHVKSAGEDNRWQQYIEEQVITELKEL